MRSITDRLPLRDSTVWDAYREAAWIAQRFGVCGGAALQYDATRTRWRWADHPCMSVDQVLVNGVPATGWAWSNTLDSTGRAGPMIVFTSPVDEGASVIARGRGKMHAITGALLDNPGDVLYDILVNVAGLDYPAAVLDEFRAATTAAGIVVGGSIESDDPAFTVVRSLCGSIGAICAPDMRGFARLYPGPAGAASAEVRRGAALSVRAQRGDVTNDLTIRYAFEAGTPRGAVQYEVPTAVARYGRNAVVVDSPWLTERRVAAAVAERLLGLRSRRRWITAASDIEGEIAVGAVLDVDHPVLPVSGEFVVLGREYDPTNDTTTVRFEAPIGSVPAMVLRRNTLASSALEPQSATATVQGGQVTIVIADDNGNPIAGADCTIDGNITRRSDNAGRVIFPAHAATPGQHTIVARYGDRTTTIVLQVS